MAKWAEEKGSRYSNESVDKPKEPHKDYNNNLNFANNIIRKKNISVGPLLDKNKLCYAFSGTNKKSDGSFGNLTSITFSWKTKGVQYGSPINLHQIHQDFRDAVATFFDEKL